MEDNDISVNDVNTVFDQMSTARAFSESIGPAIPTPQKISSEDLKQSSPAAILHIEQPKASKGP